MTAPQWWDVETACVAGTLLLLAGPVVAAWAVVRLAELAGRVRRWLGW